MKIVRFFAVFFLITFSINAEDQSVVEHDFVGQHLIASYLDCDLDALHAEGLLKEKMIEAAEASGMTILSTSHFHFEPKGMTQVLLLAESHASIHTYPERGACFVDLFTCGNAEGIYKFDQVLTEFLKPKKASRQMFVRGETSEEIPY